MSTLNNRLTYFLAITVFIVAFVFYKRYQSTSTPPQSKPNKPINASQTNNNSEIRKGSPAETAEALDSPSDSSILFTKAELEEVQN